MLEKSLTDNEAICALSERFADVNERIKIALKGRKVTLVGATKTVGAETINYAAENLGLRDIGENRVQELLSKYEDLRRDLLNIHFIGRLQTNKVKYIIDKVCLIHSVDSLSLAREIDRQARIHSLRMNILAEINIASETSKGGVSPDDAIDFAKDLCEFENLSLVGVMSVPPKEATKEELSEYFTRTKRILDNMASCGYIATEEPILSMGMSESFECAIECGANTVRIGSALFGKRNYQNSV